MENGIELVMDNINQLKTLINRVSSNPTQSTSPLTMKLNGTLDAAVNGGLSKFEVLVKMLQLFAHTVQIQDCSLIDGRFTVITGNWGGK